MENVWLVSALWLGLALAASVISIWVGISVALIEIMVAAMALKDRQGRAFGIMNMIYGVAWFAGSALLGILYDRSSLLSVAVVAVLLHLAAPPIFFRLLSWTALQGT